MKVQDRAATGNRVESTLRSSVATKQGPSVSVNKGHGEAPTTRNSPVKLSEADLERQCSDLLALDGWRSLKTDPVSRREWGKGFGEKGMADRLYMRYRGGTEIDVVISTRECGPFLKRQAAEVMWIEWKRLGGKAAPHQRIWIETERARGALVLLAGEDFPATFEGFGQWYKARGLMRRTGLIR